MSEKKTRKQRVTGSENPVTDISTLPVILTPKQGRDVLNLSSAAFWRLTASGAIKTITFGKKTTRIKRDDLIAYIDSLGGTA